MPSKKIAQKSLPKPIEGEVVKVIGSDIREERFSGRRYEYGNQVHVKDKDGKLHIFINGSMNQVPERLRIIGQKGWVKWMRGTTFSLEYFTDEK